jgi:hypothetical protein
MTAGLTQSPRTTLTINRIATGLVRDHIILHYTRIIELIDEKKLINQLNRRFLIAAITNQKCHQRIHVLEVCFTVQAAAGPLLRDEARMYQFGDVV